MKQCIQALTALSGVSGREDAVREYILKALADTPTEKQVSVDVMGNVICNLIGEKRATNKVMFCAHMDEVGLIITQITKEGYLRFDTLGGITDATLCGKRVCIGMHKGVIGCKTVHLCKGEEKDTIPKKENFVIDIGVDANTVQPPIQPGDIATLDMPFTEMQHLIMAKALDDRVGCAMLLELAKTTPLYDITLAFTVQEEIGTRGAGPAAFAVQPDISVVLETTTAMDVGNVAAEKQVCKVGDGPVVSFMDKGTLYDHALYKSVRTLADEMDIPNQTKTVIAGGNDAKSIQLTAKGCRMVAISVPCRYIHSPACVMSMQDVENTARLVKRLTEVLPI